MFGNNITVIHKSGKDVQADCLEWADEIKKMYQPDLIIFIAKSGFLFAEPLSQKMKCPMADLVAERPANESKNKLKPIINRLPDSLIDIILSSPLMYRFNEKKVDRIVKETKSFKAITGNLYNRILVVDDSVDTGWTMAKCLDKIKNTFPDAEIKIAAYTLISYSKKRVTIDYYRVEDTIVITSTSRKSPEYLSFLSSYENWEDSISSEIQKK